jgi:hypothetical protein
MKRNIRRATLTPPGSDAQDRWARLIGNDVAGIDGDIERAIRLYQVKYGYTRDKASTELVRRLSSSGHGRDVPLLEGSCS